MADDEKIRKRQREREDEQDARDLEEKIKKTGSQLKTNREAVGEKLEELLFRAEPLIEQLNNLYNIYISGAEQIPPTERRKNLEMVMTSLQMMSKPTPGALYKYTAIQSKFETYRNRWDKMMKDLESGKIKRRVGPGRNK